MDFHLKILKYIVALCFISSCDSGDTGRLGRYDQLVLTQRSPIATLFQQYFELGNEIEEVNEKAIKALEEIGTFKAHKWIIHELWAIKNVDRVLIECGHPDGERRKYENWTPMSSFERKLGIAWPSFKENRSDIDLWRMQFNTFGCCIQPTPTEFFNDAITLLNKANIGDILTTSKIFPGYSYTFNKIIDSIKTFFGVFPYVRCLRRPESSEQYLVEVQICFNKTHHLEDCTFPRLSYSEHFCLQRNDVSYPGSYEED